MEKVEADWLRQRQSLLGSNTWEQAADWALGLAKRTLEHVEKSRPLPEHAARLDALREKRRKSPSASDGERQALYMEARRLRREIALSHPLLDFEDLLVNKVPPPLYSHQCDQYLGRHSQPRPWTTC
jgi:hypothetical protein